MSYQQAQSYARSWAESYQKADDIPEAKIPEVYDFRNIGGHDFTGKVRNQEHCGACHVLSFLQSIEARLKVKHGKDKEIPQLSAQHMLECNYLNEGCQGGWSIFNGYLAQNGHLISEQCGPYKGTTKGDSCHHYENCEPVAKVTDSYFVQASQTEVAVDEKKIMKEMLLNGPAVGDFEAPHKFRYFDKGILVDE